MATTVFTGWRTVTPGKCSDCGSDDAWDCDGRGTIYCECQTCPACGTFDGHSSGCSDLEEILREQDALEDAEARNWPVGLDPDEEV